MSADPAMEEYIPLSPEHTNAQEYNQNLPGLGGIYNSRNLQVYHYAGNNPLKYTDPTGEMSTGAVIGLMIVDALIPDPTDLGVAVKVGIYLLLLSNSESSENEENTTPATPNPTQVNDFSSINGGESPENDPNDQDDEDIEKRNDPPRYDTDKHPSTPVGRSGDKKVSWQSSNVPRDINKREYSGHALDRMQERGLTPRVVENTIKNGVAIKNTNGTTTYSNDGVSVVLNENGGVVTVMRYGTSNTTPIE